MMSETLRIQRLRGGTLFKVIFIGNCLFFIPFSVLMGILSFFGAATLKWNGQPLTGFASLIASPFIGVFITLLVSAFLWVSTFIDSTSVTSPRRARIFWKFSGRSSRLVDVARALFQIAPVTRD